MAESYIQIGMADYGDETWAPDYVETEKLIGRDHGFLLGDIGWFLSPACDINPYLDNQM